MCRALERQEILDFYESFIWLIERKEKTLSVSVQQFPPQVQDAHRRIIGDPKEGCMKVGPLEPYHVRAYPQPSLPKQPRMLGIEHPVAAQRSIGALTVAATLGCEEDPLSG